MVTRLLPVGTKGRNYVLGLASDRIFSLDIGYCRVTVVDWFDRTPVVRMVRSRPEPPAP